MIISEQSNRHTWYLDKAYLLLCVVWSWLNTRHVYVLLFFSFFNNISCNWLSKFSWMLEIWIFKEQKKLKKIEKHSFCASSSFGLSLKLNAFSLIRVWVVERQFCEYKISASKGYNWEQSTFIVPVTIIR